MYSILRAEMYRTKRTITSVASELGITEKTFRNKLNGDSDFTWPEAQAIHKMLGTELSIAELFRRDDEPIPATV